VLYYKDTGGTFANVRFDSEKKLPLDSYYVFTLKIYIPSSGITVGTLTNKNQLKRLKEIGVDFIVSPGLMDHLATELQEAKIPFIPGIVTPSEIMRGMHLGYDTFKLFPAEIFGGVKLLKTYNGLFPDIKFCPTGGINEKNYEAYLKLPNVMCVGGSWVV
jgi:2-dehydro-3-deoxyphosphogluconate aldolase/(4S)-4-hydroxy-2-oxoglutarate aldolase